MLSRARNWLAVIRPASILLTILILAYIAWFGWLAVTRHQAFRSAAMDLGYTDQVVWNTLHGRFMEFSTYQGAQIDLPLEQFRRTDILLAYHVELLLAPISLLYLVYSSPVTLLILQVVVIGLGALPAFWLARKHTGSEFAGLVFAAAYLLAPALQGAVLSDFHAVSLTASLLLFAFYFCDERRYWAFLVMVCLAMLTKEEIPIPVLMLGLYLLLRKKERKIGALTALLGLGWFLIATQVILPYYNGLPHSPFLDRMAVFGPTIGQSVRHALRTPSVIWRWLRQPEIVAYGTGLLASGGFMSLFNPVVLALTAPVLMLNIFSDWSWTYSEGAHYSASLIPFVIVSAIFGLAWLSAVLARRSGLPRTKVAAGLAVLVLGVSVHHQWQIGMTPLARDFHRPQVTAHDRLAAEFVAQIPSDAALSAQSNLYPHVAHRQKAYFFPAVNDAEYVFLDVTSPPYPFGAGSMAVEIQQLFEGAQFGVVRADDGYLLLRRDAPEAFPTDQWRRFLTFARTNGQIGPCTPLRARFGDALELVGYDYAVHNVVTAGQLPVTVTTYWRALRPLDQDYGFAFFFTRDDGAVVGNYSDATPTTAWYPTGLWQPGEVVRVETPVLSIGRRRDVLMAVTIPAADPDSIGGRVRPVAGVNGQSVEVFQEGSLLKLLSLRSAWAPRVAQDDRQDVVGCQD